MGEALTRLRVHGFGRAMPPLQGLLDHAVAEDVDERCDDALAGADHLAALEPQAGDRVAELSLGHPEHDLADLLTGRLDRAPGDVRLAGRGGGAARPDLGVLAVHDNAVHAQLGATDLLHRESREPRRPGRGV